MGGLPPCFYKFSGLDLFHVEKSAPEDDLLKDKSKNENNQKVFLVLCVAIIISHMI